MVEPYQSKAWKLIAQEAVNIDAFVTPSNYYKNLFISKTGISGENCHVVPMGIDERNLNIAEKRDNYPAIGYYCRISSQNGFDKLVDAFIELKTADSLRGLTLHVSGGYTGDDKKFISRQIKKINKNGLQDYFRIYPEFQEEFR